MTENLTTFENLNDARLHATLLSLVQTENKITAEIVSYISEVDRRRLYLQHSCTSLFQYLTKLGYAPASAQRRIDAARINNQVPVCEALESGELNLTQVSIVAQGLRRKSSGEAVTEIVKSEILEAIKNQDVRNTEVIVNQMLELKPHVHDKKHYQKDESVRVEITFTKEQWTILTRVKEVISHSDPNPGLAELFVKMASEFLKRRDPTSARKEQVVKKSAEESTGGRANAGKEKAKADLMETEPPAQSNGIIKTKKISARDRRAVFQRDRCCQWREGDSGTVCASKYQCQIDHIHPLWAGGANNLENLQLLCGVHNRLKYEQETGASGGGEMAINYAEELGGDYVQEIGT